MTFEQAIRLAGLMPRDVVPDGRWRRCATESKPRKRNGAYKLALDGRVGWFRDWADPALALCTWRDDGSGERQRIDPAVMRQRRDAERRQRLMGMRRVAQLWGSGHRPTVLHPYLANKGLGPVGTSGLRVAPDGDLLVPVMLGERLINVQRINKDGGKLFVKDAPVKAGALVLERDRAVLTCFVEGLATGLAVYQSVRNARVVVCFDAGNLVPVVDRMQPRGSVVIAADNDHQTMARRGFNPGLEAAQRAAEVVGAGCVWPTDIEGTDFADSVKEYGAGGARRIERAITAAVRYVSGAVP